MENVNDQLVVEKKQHDGEEKTYTREEKKLRVSLEKISWTAIFSGVLITAVSQMLFSLLGFGIGLSTIDPLREQDPMRGLGMATIIWWSVTMLISLFFGGMTTGSMYPSRSKTYLTWHGLLTWSTFALFSFLVLTTSAGMLILGTGNVIGTAITAGTSADRNTPMDISGITRSVNSFLMQPNHSAVQKDQLSSENGKVGAEENAQINTLNTARNVGSDRTANTLAQQGTARKTTLGTRAYFTDEVQDFFQQDNIQNQESKEALINNLSAQTGISQAEARNKVNSWINSYKELKANAKVKADQTAKAISIASILGFVALMIGALVTVWGTRVAGIRQYANYRTERPYVKTAV